jgi:hypothetical protein
MFCNMKVYSFAQSPPHSMVPCTEDNHSQNKILLLDKCFCAANCLMKTISWFVSINHHLMQELRINNSYWTIFIFHSPKYSYVPIFLLNPHTFHFMIYILFIYNV